MAYTCPVCKSGETAAGLQSLNCLHCGAIFDFEGNTVAPGPDENTKRVLLERLAPKTHNLAGNIADLQRAGAPGGPDSVGEVARENDPTGGKAADAAKAREQWDKAVDKLPLATQASAPAEAAADTKTKK